MDDPTFSVITINYNNADGLATTLKSVMDQSTDDFEYIVIDGGSTDGSVDCIKANADSIDYWVSEKDSGIYRAMNKGIEVAKGKYLLFLNSGDYFSHTDVIQELKAHNGDEDVLYWNVNLVSTTHSRVKIHPVKLSFD